MELTIAGSLRVDTTSYGLKAGLDGAGINCILQAEPSKLIIKSTGLNIFLSVFHESTAVEVATKEAPNNLREAVGESENSQAKKDRDSIEKFSVKIFDAVTIYEGDLN